MLEKISFVLFQMVLAFGLTILIVSTYTTLHTPSPAEISQPAGVSLEKDLEKLPVKDDTKLDLDKKQVSDIDSKKGNTVYHLETEHKKTHQCFLDRLLLNP